MRIHRGLGASLCLVLSTSSVALEAPRKLADYDLRVSLEPATHRLDGEGTLTWTNPSTDRIPELKLHLYWNAFRNNRSTFFKESGGQLRGDEADKDSGWGYIDVTSMTWDGQDLTKGFRFESPDDGNPDDRTVLSVSLPRPVEAGETIKLQMAWKSRAPRVFARAGYVREFYMLGQWFPKIAKYEPAGTRRRVEGGWNAHQYHANSEFYADWGDYRVEMTVPERFVVVSAGRKVDEKKVAGGKKSLTYVQESIHDFAWSTDPRYVVKEDLFDPARDLPAEEVERASRILGRSPEELRKGFRPVKLFFAMQPDHLDQWTRYADAQKWALVWFGLYAFPYPYDQVTIVDPPEDGEGASGMEYQTIYTAGTTRTLGRWPLDKVRLQELVVIHEFGHGYWAGLLASNEFEESWMDEGINSFTEAEMLDRRYGLAIELPWGVGFAGSHLHNASVFGTDYDPIVRHSWKFRSSGSYGRNSYPRPSVAIQQLRKLLGEETFWRGFRRYAERWRFDHPTTEDFFDALFSSSKPTAGAPDPMGSDVRNLGLGVDALRAPQPVSYRTLRSFVNQTWYGTGFVDFRVQEATTRKAEETTGYDDAGKPVNFVEPEKGKKARKDDKKGKDKDDDDSPAGWSSTVVITRSGEVSFPVDVLLTFKNGQTHRTTWDGQERWLRLTTTYSSPLVKVVVDPDRKIVMDKDPLNNARYLSKWKGPSASAKARTYLLHLVQIALSTLWVIS